MKKEWKTLLSITEHYSSTYCKPPRNLKSQAIML